MASHPGDSKFGCMAERLTALDATFLELEDLDDGALMSIGGTMVFDPLPAGAPTLDELRERLTTRLAALPRYTQRLSSPHVPAWSWPHWVEDEHFDVANHVSHVALPAPGDDGQLCDWAAEFFSHPLDRTRPLWELALIEGLAHGRWALGIKVHRCLIDGLGSVAMTDALLDTEPDPEFTTVSDDGAAPDGTPTWLHPPDAMVQATGAGLRAASAGVRAALHPTEAFERSVAVAALVQEEISGAPRTSLNVPIGPSRRYAVVRVPLHELKAMRHALGGSVNDVVLAACTGGLRRLLEARGETLPKRGLRAMVPMNVTDITAAESLGNKVTSLFVDLPVRESDPAQAPAEDRGLDPAAHGGRWLGTGGRPDRRRRARPAGRRARGAGPHDLRPASVQRDDHERAGPSRAAVRVRCPTPRGAPRRPAGRRARGRHRDLLLQRRRHLRRVRRLPHDPGS